MLEPVDRSPAGLDVMLRRPASPNSEVDMIEQLVLVAVNEWGDEFKEVFYPEETHRKRIPDPGYIDFPDRIVSANVVHELKAAGARIPGALSEWQHLYDFHRLPFTVTLENRPMPGMRGARHFHLEVEILTEGGDEECDILDIAPQTRWENEDYGATGTAELGYEAKADALMFGKASAKATAAFEVRWQPKVGAVIAGATGHHAWWKFNRAEGEWRDGEWDFSILVRRAHTARKLTLRVVKAEVIYDFFLKNHRQEPAYVDAPLGIPVIFTATTGRRKRPKARP